MAASTLTAGFQAAGIHQRRTQLPAPGADAPDVLPELMSRIYGRPARVSAGQKERACELLLAELACEFPGPDGSYATDLGPLRQVLPLDSDVRCGEELWMVAAETLREVLQSYTGVPGPSAGQTVVDVRSLGSPEGLREHLLRRGRDSLLRAACAHAAREMGWTRICGACEDLPEHLNRLLDCPEGRELKAVVKQRTGQELSLKVRSWEEERWLMVFKYARFGLARAAIPPAEFPAAFRNNFAAAMRKHMPAAGQ